MPFADHNAMIDPSTADVTARVLSASRASAARWTIRSSRVAWISARVSRRQTAAWYGRWGVNYIYGTSGVLRAADALDAAISDYCQRGAAWLASVQNSDGGFGETCASYSDSTQKGRGRARLADRLGADSDCSPLAAPATASPSEPRAICSTRRTRPDPGTNTPRRALGFHACFYLEYGLYRHSFSLSALARYRAPTERPEEFRHGRLGCVGMRRTRRDFPSHSYHQMTSYILGNRLPGIERFPLVLMLEPLHACNLACTGCGRIREYRADDHREANGQRVPAAVEECRAPIRLHLRRRTDHLSGVEDLVPSFWTGKAHLPFYPRHVHPAALCTSSGPRLTIRN